MNDDVDEIEEYPAALFVACPSEAFEAHFSGGNGDFVGDGPHLPVARTSDNDEIVRGGRDAFKVENDDVSTMCFMGEPGGDQGELFCRCSYFFCQIEPLTILTKERAAPQGHPYRLLRLSVHVNCRLGQQDKSLSDVQPLAHKGSQFYNDSCENDADHGHELEKDIQAWACGVLEGVTNSIADDSGLVGG